MRLNVVWKNINKKEEVGEEKLCEFIIRFKYRVYLYILKTIVLKFSTLSKNYSNKILVFYSFLNNISRKKLFKILKLTVYLF